jgi:carboxymethylenebutenolidase
MCDDDIHQGLVEDPSISRRTFGMTIAAVTGLTAAQAHAQSKVVEKDVDVKTPEGVADSALFYPEGKGPWPAVLIWTDIMGLRPAFREMGRRIAAQGYVVLVPNPFYRKAHAPVVDANFDINKPEDRARVFALGATITPAGGISDGVAYIAFLDAQPQTNKKVKVGVQGHCMGGNLTIRTAANQPDRVGAAATFHGGNGMATDKPDSPHLLIAKMKASALCAVAQNDDMQNPKVKDMLKTAFESAKLPATVEVYPAQHGWTVKGSAVYNEAAAEHAHTELMALYKKALV